MLDVGGWPWQVTRPAFRGEGPERMESDVWAVCILELFPRNNWEVDLQDAFNPPECRLAHRGGSVFDLPSLFARVGHAPREGAPWKQPETAQASGGCLIHSGGLLNQNSPFSLSDDG